MRMRHYLPFLAGTFGMLTNQANAANVILTVGPAGQYHTISAAVAAADADADLDNYYDIQVAPGTYTNDFPEVTRPMTIESAIPPSRTSFTRPVVLNATILLPNQKGIILTTSSLTVNGLSFQGAMIDDSLGGNGAGIRDQNTGPGARLTVLNSTFTANQEGILTGDDPDETVTILNSYFINNGNPNHDVFQHGVYVNGGTLAVSNSLFCGQLIGHDIKSRASVTTITAVTTYEGQALPNVCRAGTASLSVDVPNGGVFVMTGSQLFQGAASENSKMVDYGEEGLAYSTNSIFLQGNSFTSTGLSAAIGIYDPFCIPVTLVDNTNIFNGVATPVSPPECADFVPGGPNPG
jgi:hypothetical protein